MVSNWVPWNKKGQAGVRDRGSLEGGLEEIGAYS